MAFIERQGGVNQQSQSKLLAAVKEKEHKNRRKSYKEIQLETKTIGSFSAVTLDTALDDSTDKKNVKQQQQQQQGGTYNLSCKVCNCKSHHYTGQTDDLMSTLKELPKTNSKHYLPISSKKLELINLPLWATVSEVRLP